MKLRIFFISDLIIIFIVLIFVDSCYLDQVESEYEDYENASKDSLFDKGWIPRDLIFQSMTDIYQRTNLDINSCIFSFNLSELDVIKIKEKVIPTEKKIIKIQGIRIPNWWMQDVIKSNHYYYYIAEDKKEDTIYIAIDDKVSKIYGWRK
jgi:hypothetical protein